MVTEKKRVQLKVDRKLVEEVEFILTELGLNQTTAVTAFYKGIVSHRGMPFPLRLNENEKENSNLIKEESNISTANSQ